MHRFMLWVGALVSLCFADVARAQQAPYAGPGHVAALLPDQSVLVLGGAAADGSPTAAAQLFAPDGTFVEVGPMGIARGYGTATQLRDGRVLIVGGEDASGPVASIEIFELAPPGQPGGSFRPSQASLLTARTVHEALVLHDGRVLIRGGYDASGVAVAADEIYDPATDTVSPADPALEYATIFTDKTGYVPGDTVYVKGGRWQPGEDVHLLFDADPMTVAPRVLTLTTDANGQLQGPNGESLAALTIAPGDLGAFFTLHAVGGTSSISAVAYFSDAAHLSIGTPNPSSRSGNPGDSFTFAIPVTNDGDSNLNNVSAKLMSPPTGFTSSSTTIDPLRSGNSGTLTLTVTAATTTARGTYTLSVSACDGKGNPTCSSTASITIDLSALVNVTVTADDKTRAYGASNPAFTYAATGFGGGVTFTTPPTCSTTATATSPVGAYPITCSGGVAPAGYSVQYVDGSLSVTKKSASVTPSAASKTYGDADPNPLTTGALTGFLPADNVTASYSRASGESVAGSPYTISATLSPSGVLGNYDITYNTAQFTIAKKAASVTPDAATKVYGATDPALTGTLSGFLAADGVTVTYSRTAGESVAGGPYTISATLSPAAVLSNYDVTYNTAAFTITKKTASVTPSAASKTYGDADPNPLTTGTLTGFLPADNVTASYARTAGETVAGGPYTISATLSPSDVLENYDITYNTAQFMIAKKAASVTPKAASKTYGEMDPNPLTTGTLAGFLTADNVTATYSRTSGETVAASPYKISATLSPADVLGNYEITYSQADFTINKRAASVTPNSASKTYGDADPNPLTTGTLAGFLSADNVTGSYARTAGETVAGGPYTITATLSPASVLGNYDVTYNTAAFTITKRAASVTPNAASKTYGEMDPAPLTTGTLAGFLSADNVTATYSRTSGEAVAGSPYKISATLNAAAGVLANYDVTSNTADFTINKRPASVTPNAASKTYGDADPSPLTTGTLAGFLNADNVTASYARAAGETVAGGPYSISATLSPSGVLGNYDVTYNTASFTISKRTLKITADDKSMILHGAAPAFTVRYDGWAFTDGPSVLSGTLSCSSTATGVSGVGPYPITCGGQSSTNYAITYKPGTLTVMFAAEGVACGSGVGRQMLPPIANGNVHKAGSTVPAKFQVCDAFGVPVGPAPGQPVITDFEIVGVLIGTSDAPPEEGLPDIPDTAWRWSEAQWHFNISTKTLGLAANRTYLFRIALADGTDIRFPIQLK